MIPVLNKPANALKLYDFPLSGHCHRIRLMLSLLDLPHELQGVDLMAGEHRQPAFLALNAFGQVPVLRDGELVLADSNAILVYLAGEYGGGGWLPRAPAGQAAVTRWLSVAAGELNRGPAAARLYHQFKVPCDIADTLARSHRLLALMESLLAARDFLAGESATIADVAMYSYTAHAPEGGVSLSDYPAIGRWLARIEALPGFVAMPARPLPSAAQALP